MESLKLTGAALFERMERAVEKIEQRLRRTSRVLEQAAIPYAIVGGNAVRIWVSQVDEGAVRTTKDVDVLIRPEDLPRVIDAMCADGFVHRVTSNINMFVESENASAREAVHIVLSGEKIRPDDFESNPDVEPFESGGKFRTLTLEALVRMKLNAFRLKDRVHLIDMIQAGLIDATWPEKFPEPLQSRMQGLVDNPDQ